eukprot:13081947-Alexandrium_andersonii.AAC.1
MRMVRPKPYGVPPRPESGDAPAEGGEEKKKTPAPKTPPRNPPKPKSAPAPADGGGVAATRAELERPLDSI